MGRRVIPKQLIHPQVSGFTIKVQDTKEENVLGPNPGILKADADPFFAAKRLHSGCFLFDLEGRQEEKVLKEQCIAFYKGKIQLKAFPL